MYERKKFNPYWTGAIAPFRIVGNVYFCGTYPASSHLIDTGDGLILIDTGYFETLHLLVNSIYTLGYRPTDVRYIIHTHFHYDHTGATAAFAALSGAKTLISERDARPLSEHRYFVPDLLLRDGDTVTLGNTSLLCLETPGHTPGTLSLFFDTVENGKVYRVGMFGGAGRNTLVKSSGEYRETSREEYFGSIERLLKEPVDIFIGNHVWNNDTEGKRACLLKNRADGNPENPFIDANEFPKFLRFCKQDLESLIAAGK